VLLAADTRVTYYPRGKPVFWKDRAQKIRHTKLGLIVGAGNGRLLDNVADKLDGEDGAAVRGTDDIERIVKREQDAFPRQADPQLAEMTAGTGWLSTYIAAEFEPPRILGVRLCLVGGTHRFGRLEDGTAYVLMPGGATQEQFDSAMSRIHKLMVPLEDIEDGLAQNLARHLALAGTLIQDAAKEFSSVSRTFQVGVHTSNGYWGISPFIEDMTAGVQFELFPPGAERRAS
jgi:hypothetical protein